MCKNFFTIYYQNVRGLRTKTNQLYLNSLNLNLDVIIFTETWLTDNYENSEIFSDKYIVYRTDRSERNSIYGRGGGVLIAINSQLQSNKIIVPNNDVVEELYVLVSVNSAASYIFGAVYIPPASEISVYEYHTRSVEYIFEHYPETKLSIMGDYNFPSTTFLNNNEGILVTEGESNTKTVLLSDSFNYLGLHQINTVQNHLLRTLDLVFVNVDKFILNKSTFNIIEPDIHHPPLYIEIDFDQRYDNLISNNYWKYQFRKADYTGLNDYLSEINWPAILTTNTEEALTNFYDIIYTAIDIYVPKIFIQSDKYPQWFTISTRKKLREKNKIYNKFKKDRNNISLRNKYNNLRSETKLMIKHDYDSFLNSIQTGLNNNNIKSFWSYVKSKRTTRVIPKEVHYNGVISTTGPETAQIFAQFFESVYTTKSAPFQNAESNTYSIINICNLKFTVDEVFEELTSLDVNKSAGPDNISPYFVKMCSPSLALPLSIIFNASLNEGTFPQLWKCAYLTPLFKSGDANSVTNYRPISGLCSIAKVFESLVTSNLGPEIEKIIVPEQHGYLTGKSTCSNLAIYTNHITEAIEGGMQLDSVYTDFKKAFDRVDHTILLHKCKDIGLCGSLLQWLNSYLSDRTLTVKIDNYCSIPFCPSSGVPQGSHLGPLLFLIFINDILLEVKCKALLFADDLKIFIKVKDHSDCLKLQNDLNKILSWCVKNKMELNINKCKTVTFSKKKSPILFNYNIDGMDLARVNTIDDLGVIFTSDFSFNQHIDTKIKKAYKMCGFIRRHCTDFTDINSILILYRSLVLCGLEYCSVIWNPKYMNSINRIENLQNKFAKFILYKLNINYNELNYEERIHMIGFDTLEKRRFVNEIFFSFKIINNMYKVPELREYFPLRVPSHDTRSQELLYIEHHNTTYGQHSMKHRLRQSINYISSDIDIFNITLEQLKRFCKHDMQY